MGKAVKGITGGVTNLVKNPGQIFKDPVRALGNVLPLTAAMTPGGLLASGAVQKVTGGLTQPLPEVPNYTEPRAQQNALVENQLKAAQGFSQRLPQALNEEMAATRAGLQDELQGAVRGARGAANARGMLFSGRRMAQEGGLANQAAQQLARARAGAIQRLTGQEQEMFAQPLRSRANIAETNMQQQDRLNQYRQATDAARTGLLTTGMGLLGQGAGTYLANQQPSITSYGNPGAMSGGTSGAYSRTMWGGG